MMRMKHTSEVAIYITVLTMNLFRKLRLSFGSFGRYANRLIILRISMVLALVYLPFAYSDT